LISNTYLAQSQRGKITKRVRKRENHAVAPERQGDCYRVRLSTTLSRCASSVGYLHI